MLRNQTVGLALILGWAILSGTGHAVAQEGGTPPKPATQPEGTEEAAKAARPPEEAYRLEFSINELEDGKKINSRQHSMNLTTNESNEIKIGTRVPVETGKEGEFQYLDVGTNISARLSETRGQTELVVRADISSLAPPEPTLEKRELHPIVRQVKMGGSVLLPLAKTIVLGSADDPNSKRQFQLEVTVTKLR
jgi:hypothetical protein